MFPVSKVLYLCLFHQNPLFSRGKSREASSQGSEDLTQKHTVGHPVRLPACTAALASPSSGWGRFLGPAARPAQLVPCCHRGSCSGALVLAHLSSAAHWGASGADSPISVPPAAAVRTKFPGVELSLSDTWKGGRRGSLLGSLWCFG